eukprot:m.88563 g.88563  ORF g.88563 m.88563 type:complete len:262 (+) comp14946_c1_seq4:1338-2123(+)
MQRFVSRAVLVTGGTSGIGAAIASRFACEGANVVITGRAASRGKAAAQRICLETGGRCEFVQSDATVPSDAAEAVREVVARFGKLDVAVNNAGVERFRPGGFLAESLDDYEYTFDTNVRGLWLSMQAQIRQLLEQQPDDLGDRGSIINVSSITGHKAGFVALYGASKHAVLGLTKCAAKEFAPKGVRITSVCPGPTDTPLARDVIEQAGGETVLEQLKQQIPAKRLGTPEDTAGVVAFLASADARYMHGATGITIDGGLGL